jgi:monoamine oxidase
MFRSFVCALQRARRENLEAAGKPLPLTKEQTRWTRRRFLKATAIAGGLGFVSSVGPRRALARQPQGPTIAIVGGGLAGLNAAYQLQKLGFTATVYEARKRLGGRIFSVRDAVGEGLVIDFGGTFINTDHADMLALVEDFSLTLFNRIEDAERLAIPKTAYFFDGRSHSEAGVADLLRPLAAQITADADLLDADYDRIAPEFDHMSVTAYLDQHADKIPEPFIRTLIENAIRTEYGVEPEASSALQLIFLLPTVDGDKVDVLGYSDETFVVAGGSSRIIERLAQALEGQIRNRMRLVKLQSRDQGFRLTFRRPGHPPASRQWHEREASPEDEVVDADYVILALPFTVLRHVDLQVDLPETLWRFIHEVDLGSNEKLFAGVEEKFWRHEEGFGMDAWTDLGFSAIWDETQRQPDRSEGALTCYFGGRETLRVRVGSAESQGEKALHRLEAVLPGAQASANGRFAHTRWTRDRFSRGAYVNFKPGQLTAFADFFYIDSDDPGERQDVHVGNLIFAGEHLSDAYYGFMNGAAETGRLAAQVVARRILEVV